MEQKCLLLTIEVKGYRLYSLSTAFDVSTATFDGENFLLLVKKQRANSIAFNNDGTRMFVAGVGNNSQHRIHEYSLSTGFDLSSTVTHLNTEDLISFQNYIDGVTFNYDGTKMYTIRGKLKMTIRFLSLN